MHRHHLNRLAIPAAIPVAGIALSLLAVPAGAQSLYFDVNGTTAGYGVVSGGTYSWDTANWANATGGTTATSNWVQGSFARFPGGASGNSYTVTVANDEQNVGLFQTVNGVSLTLNPVGAGQLEVINGIQGFINGGSTANLTINVPITGTGGVNPSNGGNIFLNAVNTYSGGTSLTSSATLVHFNNGSAFGTGAITNNLTTATGFAPLLASGGATVTLPNNFVQAGPSGAGFNFAADANTPVISTGTWSLGALNVSLRNNGASTSPLSLTGVISGSGGMILSGANGGTINFSGANTYTGSTTVGVTGAASVTLKLAASNTIANSVSLILAGGTVNPGGFNQHMTGTTLGLTANSVIDFGAGASEMDFANSSGLAWSGNLNLLNWNAAVDALRFGTDATGLTAAQLARIQFNGTGLGTASLNPSGFLVFGTAAVSTPEPVTLGLVAPGVVAFAGAFVAVRRRSRRS